MLAYLLTYLQFVFGPPETKERTGDQEERREVGLETLKKCSVHWPGYATSCIERERERERER